MKKLLVLTLVATLLSTNLIYAEDVIDTEGIHVTAEMGEMMRQSARENTMYPDEVIRLIKQNAFTGVLSTDFGYRGSMGTHEPWNPYLQEFYMSTHNGNPKYNPWFMPAFNSDYYLYGITYEEYAAMTPEQQQAAQAEWGNDFIRVDFGNGKVFTREATRALATGQTVPDSNATGPGAGISNNIIGQSKVNGPGAN